jgi:hypothetical protein
MPEMDVIEYLHEFGKELVGLNDDPAARLVVLRYVREQLEFALAIVKREEGESDGNDSTEA